MTGALANGPSCPAPLRGRTHVVLGHGSGGRLTHELVETVFAARLRDPAITAGDDGAVLDPGEIPAGARLVTSVDAHVVRPLEFPGGDIGRLAVCGTVNDVAAMGAMPSWLTAGFVLEEGLEIALLERVVDSMRATAEDAGVRIVAGDTKVVQRGRADGLYICTSGVGVRPPGVRVGGALARPGDDVLVSGPVGDHGVAVLAARGELGVEVDVRSDVGCVHRLVAAALDAGGDAVHVLRDPTRGGLGTTLHEIAVRSGVGVMLEEDAIPVRPAVRAACELLGLDPLHVACEGRLVVVVSADRSDAVLDALRELPESRAAMRVGHVAEAPSGRVLAATPYGSHRIVEPLPGEMLPRIC